MSANNCIEAKRDEEEVLSVLEEGNKEYELQSEYDSLIRRST